MDAPRNGRAKLQTGVGTEYRKEMAAAWDAITVDASYTHYLSDHAVDLGEYVWITPVAYGKCP